jgi:hypothetical protein
VAERVSAKLLLYDTRICPNKWLLYAFL